MLVTFPRIHFLSTRGPSRLVLSKIFFVFILTVLSAPREATLAQDKIASSSQKPVVRTELGAKAEKLLDRYATYGMSGTVLIIKDGQVVFHQAYGLADRESRRPNTLDTLYDVGSIAKTFTATAILQLEMQGRLKTTDLISKFLGDFPADKSGITIHQLLTHTAGLSLDAGDVGISSTTAPDEFLRKVKAGPLLSAPGENYSYSNLGYGLLAIIIEKLSGKSWQNYLKENILKPAGLSRTMLYGDTLPANVLANGYTGSTEDDLELEQPLRLERPDSYVWRKYTIGSGGVFSATAELYKWWQILHSDKLLSPVARTKMFSVQAATQGYGWNIQTPPNGTARIYRGGLRGSYQSLLAYYPKENALLIYGLNKNVSELSSLWAGVVWNNLEKLIAGKDYVVPPAVVSVPAAARERHAGNYVLPNGEGFIVRAEGNSLFIGAVGQSAVNLLAYPQQTPPPFQNEIGQAGKRVVELLSRKDLTELTRVGFVADKDLPILLNRWQVWMSTTGGLSSFQVLGVSPGSGGNPRTFVRLNGQKTSLVIRLLWNWNQKRVTAWGDNIGWPASMKLRPESETSFVNFDLDKSQTVRVRFSASGPSNSLIVSAENGQNSVAVLKTDQSPQSGEPVVAAEFVANDKPTTLDSNQPATGLFAEYAGRFETPRGLVKFTQEGGKLVGEAGGDRLELTPDPTSKDIFRSLKGSERIAFARDAGGKIIGVTILTGSGLEIKGKRVN